MNNGIRWIPVSLFFFSAIAVAAPTPWSGQPAWSTGASASFNNKRSTQKRSFNQDISPFAPDSNNLALDVGQVFLMGDLSDKYGDSIGSQLHYTYGVSDIFGFDASLGYSSHSEGKLSMTSLLTGLRTNLAWYDKIIPYAMAGLGFYRPSYEIAPLQSVSQLVFGLHMGAGVDLVLTRQLYFGSAITFHDIFGTRKMTEQGPVDIGGTYTSFYLHLGVTF